MTATVVVDRASAARSWSARVAPVAIIVGGLLMVALFVPFTLTHGPTSYNEEHDVLGWDMHAWGFLLGVLPNVLVAGGLWRLRARMAAARLGATVVVAVVCVAMLLDALMNLAFRALGPPFVLFLLAPATSALVALIPAGDAARTRTRVVVAALGIVLGVDPFDQPNVSEAKAATEALLAEYRRDGAFRTPMPIVAEPGLAASADPAALGDAPPSVAAAIRSLLGTLADGDYFAILAYLPPDTAVSAALERLRVSVRDEIQVLEHGVGGAAVPVAVSAAPQERLEEGHPTVTAVEVPRPPHADVVDE